MKILTKKTMLSIALAGACIFSAHTSGFAAEKATEGQTIARLGTYDSAAGPAQFFTGNSRIDNLYAAKGDMRSIGAYVTFEPGARSNWHTHPVGQALIITAGVGLTQEWGGPVVELHPGDVVQCPAGVKHWHGASPNMAMTHISICEEKDGRVVDWLEKVTDEQYNGKRAQ